MTAITRDAVFALARAAKREAAVAPESAAFAWCLVRGVIRTRGGRLRLGRRGWLVDEYLTLRAMVDPLQHPGWTDLVPRYKLLQQIVDRLLGGIR